MAERREERGGNPYMRESDAICLCGASPRVLQESQNVMNSERLCQP